MKHGIKGLLAEDIVDLGKETDETLAGIRNVPAAALGSVRMKPTKADFDAMVPILKKYNIKFFFYIGGNDSAETAHIVNESAKAQGYEMCCFHIPKTIDNDLRVTDHCPGFASAARFVAHAFQGDDRDLAAMGGCKINICMGRDAGWLTAAATLGRREGKNDGPHLVYLPEAVFDPEEFVASIKACLDAHGRCLVAVSEGIRDAQGELYLATVKELTKDSHGASSFLYARGNCVAATKLPAGVQGCLPGTNCILGHQLTLCLASSNLVSLLGNCPGGGGDKQRTAGNTQMGGTGALGDALAGLVKAKLGSVRCRADTFGYIQRNFPVRPSVEPQGKAEKHKERQRKESVRPDSVQQQLCSSCAKPPHCVAVEDRNRWLLLPASC
eukprot:SAG22_NODE_953_length_6332_cov_5.830258_2_plen_384_part_00